MKKISVGVVTGVRVSYYYERLELDGSWSGTHVFQGSTGPIASRYLDHALTKRAVLKPWSSQWEQQGYTLIDRVEEDIPDLYPSWVELPLISEKQPSLKRGDFLMKQRLGTIVVSDIRKESVTIHYTRGTVVTPGTGAPTSAPYSSIELFKPLDIVRGGGQTIRLVNSPSVQWLYSLGQSVSDLHPFDLGWDPRAPVVPPFSFNNGVITSALASAESGVYDLLTEIAELPSTVSFLGDCVKKASAKTQEHVRTVKHYVKLLRTATGKFAEKIAKKLASAWLAYRYAIMPLVYSIEDIKKTLKDYKRVFAKYRGEESSQLEMSFPGFEQVGFATLTERCWIKRAYSPEDLVDQLLGVLKINIFSTAWELVTLSFVVDWFINIGDVITAFTGNKAYLDQAATTSRKAEGSSVYQSKEVPAAKVEINFNTYERKVIEPRDHIGLSLSFDLSWKRQLDAIALALSPSINSLKRIKRNV